MKELHEIFFKNGNTMYSDLVALECGQSHEAVEKAGRDVLARIERFAGHDLGVYEGYRVRLKHSPWKFCSAKNDDRVRKNTSGVHL